MRVAKQSVLALSLAALTLPSAACGSTSGASSSTLRTVVKATDLPPASQVAANSTVVAPGTWGIVQRPDLPVTYAVKATAIQHGKPGELGDVRVLNGYTDLSTATPYYISFDYVVLAGNKNESPIRQLTAIGTTDVDKIITLSISNDLYKCDPPADKVVSPPDTGYVLQGCVVAVAAAGTEPTFLRYYELKGSKDVRFPIPAG